jgi:phage head maturation protease
MADTEVDTKEAPAGDTSRAFATRTLGVDMEARTVRAYITTPDLDADGEVVLPRGADLSRFKKNPIVFQVHNYGSRDVVGRVESLKMEDDGIIATVRFSPRPPSLPAEQEWLADTLLWLFHVGDLKGWSIGFMTQDARSPSKADRERWGDGLKRVITRWMLCELSVAPLPNNPAALTLSMKGLISNRLAEVLTSGRAITREELPELASVGEVRRHDETTTPDDATESMPHGQVPRLQG